MWQWCVSRSSTAPVSRWLPSTSVHCSKGRFVVTITLGRSPLTVNQFLLAELKQEAERIIQCRPTCRGVVLLRDGRGCVSQEQLI